MPPATTGSEHSALLARYAPVRKIGSGTLGRTFLALQRGGSDLRRLVALKEVYATSEEDARALLERCRVVACAAHHNLAGVIDQSEVSQANDDGTHTVRVIYDYIVGESVLSLLAAAFKLQQPLPLGLALRIAADCCGALAAVHEVGDPLGRQRPVAHAALRPSNVLVTYDGCTKITDHGLAAPHPLARGARLSAAQAHFMAPEVLAGATATAASDVYSAGVLLYTTLTLRYPHEAHESLETVARAKLEKPPVPPSVRSDKVGPELERVLLQALSADPAARQRSAAALASDLEGFALRNGAGTGARGLADFLRGVFGKRAQAKRKALRGVLSMPADAVFAEATTVDEDYSLSQPRIDASVVFGNEAEIGAVQVRHDEPPTMSLVDARHEEPTVAYANAGALSESAGNAATAEADAALAEAVKEAIAADTEGDLPDPDDVDATHEEITARGAPVAASAWREDGRTVVDPPRPRQAPEDLTQPRAGGGRGGGDGPDSAGVADAPREGTGAPAVIERVGGEEPMRPQATDIEPLPEAHAPMPLEPQPALRRTASESEAPEGTTVRAEIDDSWHNAGKKRARRQPHLTGPPDVGAPGAAGARREAEEEATRERQRAAMRSETGEYIELFDEDLTDVELLEHPDLTSTDGDAPPPAAAAGDDDEVPPRDKDEPTGVGSLEAKGSPRLRE